MGDTATSELGYRKQEQGVKLVWGTDLNNYVDNVEEKQVDITTLNLTGDHPLTNTNFVTNETRKSRLIITDGGLSTAPTITVPGKKNNWWVENKGATYNVIISAGNTTATVRPGTTVHVYCDGTDCFADEQSLDKIPTAAGDVAMGSNKITGLADGSDSNDAVNKGQLDAVVSDAGAAAAASAAAAATSATNAATLATNSATSATNSANSATASATSATAASTAQTNAETAETNAETAQTAAETAQAAAEAAAASASGITIDEVNDELFKAVMPILLQLADSEGLDYSYSDGRLDDLSDYTSIDNSALTLTTQVIPDMTSNGTPSGTAASSNQYSSSFAAWKAFDRDTATYWASAGTSQNNLQLTYTFAAPTLIGAFEFERHYSGTLNYKIEVQLEDDTWVEAHSGSDSAAGQVTGDFSLAYMAKAVRWENTTAASPATYTGMKEFQVFSPSEIITNAFTALNGAPDEARVLVLVDGDGSGVTVSVSRDNGTTYTALSSATLKTVAGGKTQISGKIDISGQPSGTSVRLKVNDPDVRAYLIQWK